jgi:hypothetical protein
VSNYTNVLDNRISDNESESSDEKIIDNDEKNKIDKSEVKLTDITREQWFWDQAVMS